MQKQTNQSLSEIQSMLKSLSIPLVENELFIIVFAINSDDQKLSELSNLFLFSEFNTGFCFKESKDTYVLISNADSTKAIAFVSNLFKILQNHTDEEIYMGISRIKNSYRDLPDLLRQASTASDFCRFYSISGYKCYEELSQNIELFDSQLYLSEKNKEISLFIQEGSYEEAFKGTIELLYQIQKEKMLPTSIVKSLVVELLAMYIQKLRSYNLTEDEAIFISSIGLGQVHEKNTLNELSNWWNISAKGLIHIFESKERSYSKTVQNIIVYVRKNYFKNISLNEIAQSVYLNRSYVSTLFKKETGEHLRDYIVRVRIDKACNLLKYSSLSIAAVSEQTGFTDVAYFSRTFKKIIGVTPTVYREKNL